MPNFLRFHIKVYCIFLVLIFTRIICLNADEDSSNEFKLWPEGIIPYLIDDFSFDKGLRDKIRAFLEDASVQTGLKFTELARPPNDERLRWVLFINRRGLLECQDYFDSNFSNEGAQRILVGYDCVGADGRVALAPAVLALVGIPPQHNAPDRDKYIEVQEQNILPDKKHLFKTVDSQKWNSKFHNYGYDFVSASHYDFYKYTKNGYATITPRNDASRVMLFDDRVALSFNDISKIRSLYQKTNAQYREKTKCNQLFNERVKRRPPSGLLLKFKKIKKLSASKKKREDIFPSDEGSNADYKFAHDKNNGKKGRASFSHVNPKGLPLALGIAFAHGKLHGKSIVNQVSQMKDFDTDER